MLDVFLVLTHFPSTNTLSTQGIPHQYPEAMERSFGKCLASPTHGRVYVSWRDAKKKDAKAILGRIRNLVGKSSERGRTWILNPNEAAQLMDCSEPPQKDLKKRKVSLYMCFFGFLLFYLFLGFATYCIWIYDFPPILAGLILGLYRVEEVLFHITMLS